MPKRARCPHCDRLFNRDDIDKHIAKCRARSKGVQTRRPQRRTVIVDGNNVAYHMSTRGSPNTRNLILAYRSLTGSGYRPIFVVSSALMHRIDRPSSLNEFMLSAEVVESPRGLADDLKIIQLAKEYDADIVSNDRFLDWIDRFPWIISRLRKFRMTPAGLILV